MPPLWFFCFALLYLGLYKAVLTASMLMPAVSHFMLESN